MKIKISVKIFIVLLVAFILILGISMRVNIDAQIKTHDELTRLTYNNRSELQDIQKALDVSHDNPQSMDTLKKKIMSDEFQKDMQDNFGDREVFTYFLDAQSNSANNEVIRAFIPSQLQDNSISFLGEHQSFSLENVPKEQRERLFQYFCGKVNSAIKEYPYPYVVDVEYSLENQKIVYLKWEQNVYGTPKDEVFKKSISTIAVNGQISLHTWDLNVMPVKVNTINELAKSCWIGADSIDGYFSTSEHKDYSYYISYTFLTENGLSQDLATNTTHDIVVLSVNVTPPISKVVSEEYIHNNLFLYIGAFVLVSCLSFLFSYFLSKPIKKLESVTRAITNQNFDEEINVKSNDEIGSLAKSIDMMRRQLKETIFKLEQEIQRVKELEGLRKDFVNQFTHEMKTPLGIINGYSELIEESDNEEEVKKYLGIINRETKRINQLILSMLDLSRLEAGKVELVKSEVDLEELVTEIVDEYEVLLMKKNIKVEVKGSSVIDADEKLMNTVLHNFISNAIKHTHVNGRIVLTLDHGCSVYNEGQPIEDQQLSRIWHTFVTNDQEGSGLGLAICRSIFELHGFDYGVKNVDNGVEFYFLTYEK